MGITSLTLSTEVTGGEMLAAPPFQMKRQRAERKAQLAAPALVVSD